MSSIRSASSSHKDFDIAKVNVPLVHQVDQSPRCCDQRINTSAQCFDLRVLAYSAIDKRLPHAQTFSVGMKIRADLNCQFSGRGKYQRGGATRDGGWLFKGEEIKDGQRECRRLSGTGLGTSQDVTS